MIKIEVYLLVIENVPFEIIAAISASFGVANGAMTNQFMQLIVAVMNVKKLMITHCSLK